MPVQGHSRQDLPVPAPHQPDAPVARVRGGGYSSRRCPPPDGTWQWTDSETIFVETDGPWVARPCAGLTIIRPAAPAPPRPPLPHAWHATRVPLPNRQSPFSPATGRPPNRDGWPSY